MDPFYTKDGKEVHSLAEMAVALKDMSPEDFGHHVSAKNNDVAIWVRDVHQNRTLAEAIQKATTQEQMVTLLEEVQGAAFPQQEEYHPTDGVGKEDTNLHDSYNNAEEWNAAKEAHHPEEDIANPTGGNLGNIANQLNDGEATTDNPQSEIDHRAEAPSKEVLPVEQAPAIDSKPQPLPSDLSAPAAKVTMKDKIIFSLIGFIIGVIVGYGITFLI